MSRAKRRKSFIKAVFHNAGYTTQAQLNAITVTKLLDGYVYYSIGGSNFISSLGIARPTINTSSVNFLVGRGSATSVINLTNAKFSESLCVKKENWSFVSNGVSIEVCEIKYNKSDSVNINFGFKQQPSSEGSTIQIYCKSAALEDSNIDSNTIVFTAQNKAILLLGGAPFYEGKESPVLTINALYDTFSTPSAVENLSNWLIDFSKVGLVANSITRVSDTTVNITCSGITTYETCGIISKSPAMTSGNDSDLYTLTPNIVSMTLVYDVTVGQSAPDITLKINYDVSFTPYAALIDNWTIDAGTTNITVNSVDVIGLDMVTLHSSGIVSPGDMVITCNPIANDIGSYVSISIVIK